MIRTKKESREFWRQQEKFFVTRERLMQKKKTGVFLALVLASFLWASPARAEYCDGCTELRNIVRNTGNILTVSTWLWQELKNETNEKYLKWFKEDWDTNYVRPAIGEPGAPDPDPDNTKRATFNQNTQGRCKYSRWLHDQYQKPPQASSIISLLYQILFALQENASSDECVANDTALADAQSMAKQAQSSAMARSVIPPTATAAAWAFQNRCRNHFNPTWDKQVGDLPPFDPEAKINNISAFKCSGQKDDFVRQDRSLESLLAPLQYVAPKDMADTKSQNGVPDWFIRFHTELTDKKYLPIYAAAGFCQNIAMYALPMLSPQPSSGPGDNIRVANAATVIESLGSGVVANCWHFFEERVAYPADSAGYKERHDAQYARCEADYKKHIINSDALGKCNTDGRSTLKALADVAYRADSKDYTTYLQTLNSSTQEMILALAQGDMFKFEQGLILERQIMTEAMATANRQPVDMTKQLMRSNVETSP
jgi:hypothetical protein